MDERAGIMETVNSPEFRRALHAVTEAPIRYEDFLQLPMPKGYSHEEIWNTLIVIEKELGHTCGMKPWFSGVEKDECWYFVPKSVANDLDNLAAIASEQSHINRNACTHATANRFYLASVWEEVASLARRDGLPVSERVISDLWLGNRTPANDSEQVIVNLAQAFDDIEQLMKGNYFSRVVIMNVHEMLVKNVGELELMPVPFFSASLSMPGELTNPEYISESLDEIVNDSRNADNLQSIVIQAIQNSVTLWDINYVPSLRCLTEFLVRRAYFLFHNLPVYSYFAFSSKINQMGRLFLHEHETEYQAFSQEGLNCTWLYTGGVKAYLECARDMISATERYESNRETTRNRIENMGSLNARQKAFALTAIENPGREFSIKDYMDMHDVVYATARSDLMGLVNMGLFTMSKQGNKFVFQLKDA